MSGQRMLAAILFTDAVGFSTKASQDEESALRMLQEDFASMRMTCERHHGAILKSTGDGLIMSFDSAAQAVDCALEIQSAFVGRPPDRFQHRMGVHLCDVVLEGGDLHGDGVNIAARLEAEASPGGICLSATIYDIVKSRLPVQAKSLGSRHLKNLIEPVRLFEIAPQNAPKGTRIPPRSPRRGSNYALPIAVAFAGTCVVIAALVLAPDLRGGSTLKSTPLTTAPALAPRAGSRQTAVSYPPTKPAASSGASVLVASEPVSKQSLTVHPASKPAATRVQDPPRVDSHLIAVHSASNSKDSGTPVKTVAQSTQKAASPTGLQVVPPSGPSQMVAALSRPPQPTGEAPNGSATMAEYADLRDQVRPGYGFERMVTWLQGVNDAKPDPTYSSLLDHWNQLSKLKLLARRTLISHTADRPMQIQLPWAPQREIDAWATADGKVSFRGPMGAVRQKQFARLDPAMMRSVVAASIKEQNPPNSDELLKAFDQEYSSLIAAELRKREAAQQAKLANSPFDYGNGPDL